MAERDGDEELLLSMMLAAGRLEEAEALLRERIWDLLPDALAPLWSPLMRCSPLELVDHPALLAARLRLGPHRDRSPVSVRAAPAAGRGRGPTGRTGRGSGLSMTRATCPRER